MSVHFSWDHNKAITNIRKHKVSFEEAVTVFSDPLAVIFEDVAHSVDEMREIIIGHSLNNRLLLVYFTERGEELRIFSARPATKKERIDYEESTR